ncbi:hypothetical protein AN639_12720 [Candidatus Epulonipiscium fishelsonii]|uniref:Uncharacterized protein n=1 Tax=Candidatus Epulonipiscium fishelsonii TaxID=77094 RepID=A0ACC8XGZ4_9FIRM|nr:hypothetical protein AN639_12720 [Epulopiscium sp. SCG-B05WGA-EpuloA1]ONI42717.1 hypothetical protein AN396_13540 [Epulopiscium sp. SCG-B11WGA-EpuloA1]
MDYLHSISGKKTILGIHNREPNAIPDLQTNKISELTSKKPALYSADFLFLDEDVDNRWKIVKECKKKWIEGMIPQLMLHVVAPTLEDRGVWDGGVQTKLTDAQWEDLITDGGKLNKIWKLRLDTYAVYLKYLQEENVPVLFRPFHEMNQAAFWWAGRKGLKGTSALYKITRDYLEDIHKLNNLIFVWNIQDLDYEWEEYHPGNSYYDIFSLDVYNEDGFTKFKYDKMLDIAGDKLIAIGECAVLPTVQELIEQPRWVFVMSWAELTFEYNSNQKIIDLYNSEIAVTL